MADREKDEGSFEHDTFIYPDDSTRIQMENSEELSEFAGAEPAADNGTGVEREDTSSDERITDPFDPTLIRVETKTMTIDLLLKRIEHHELDLTPGCQRKGGIWSDG